MIHVHADIRIKEKQVILSPIPPKVSFDEEEKSTLSDLGYRANMYGHVISGYDTYNLTKGLLEVEESPGLTQFLQDLLEASLASLNALKLYLDSGAPMNLWEFQREFVYWFNDPLRCRSSVMNCCEPGLGKTLQSLTAILALNPEANIIILCPKNAIGTWIKHLKIFNYKLPVHLGQFKPEENGCSIITYESLPPMKKEANEKKRFLEDYKFPKGMFIIADEFHKTKNSKTKMTKRFRKLFKLVVKDKGGKCIALTGTPIMSYESDMKTLLTNVDLFKCTFGKATVFDQLYGGTFDFARKKYTWNPKNRQPEEIHKRLSHVVFIKKKKDVYSQLPEVINTYIKLDLTVPKDDKKILDKLNPEDKQSLREYQRIRTALATAKFNRALETIEEYELQEKKIIVCSYFKDTVITLGNRKGWKYITGDTAPLERDRLADGCNNGLWNLAITIGAGNTSLNIPDIDTMLFIDLSLTNGENDQVKGRIDRISNIKPKLNYVYFITDHPFELAMYENLLGKEQLVADSIGQL